MPKKLFIYTFIFITACVPVQNNYTTNTTPIEKQFFTDKIYASKIKTVQLYPDGGSAMNQTLTPVIPISRNNLVLEFDDLSQNNSSFRAKIYNCTYNWEKSKLPSLEYLYDYNEFDINTYEYSIDTDFPYIHYRFNIPKVKSSGNYAIVVYRNNNESDIVLTKRFMVYETQVEIIPTEGVNTLNNLTRKNQRIEFFVRYKNYSIDNPRQSIMVQLRQNGRWDNALQGLQPSYVREDIRELEYRFFNTSELIKGGNEFRFFDFRSVKHPGYRVKKMDRVNGEFIIDVDKDKIRSNLAYSQYRDKNGKFYIHNQDFDNPSSTSNYARVNFSLSNNKIPYNSEIYLFGALTNYEMTSNNRLQYNSESKAYELQVLLKQGHYDYQYYSKNDSLNYNYIEGDYFETENEYEILIYHRPFGSRTDLLIGYKTL